MSGATRGPRDTVGLCLPLLLLHTLWPMESYNPYKIVHGPVPLITSIIVPYITSIKEFR